MYFEIGKTTTGFDKHTAQGIGTAKNIISI